MPTRRNDRRRSRGVEYVYDGERAAEAQVTPHAVPKNIADFPSWLRTLVAIVVTAVSAGAGLTIWLNGHYVSSEKFDNLAMNLERADYVTRADYVRQVESERIMAQKADLMAAEFASLKTDLTWVKLALTRIEEQQRKVPSK